MDKRYGHLLLHKFILLYKHPFSDPRDHLRAIYDLLYAIIVEISDETGIQFHSLYARIAYLSSYVPLPFGLSYHLHFIRKNIDDWILNKENRIDLLVRAGIELICTVYKIKLSEKQLAGIPPPLTLAEPQPTGFLEWRLISVVVVGLNKAENLMEVVLEDQPKKTWVRYNVLGINDHFNSTIEILHDIISLPVSMTLVDVKKDAEGYLIPAGFVLQPDFLVDITAVADACGAIEKDCTSFILKKFLPAARSLPILIGNITGVFLDELIRDPSISFKELCANVFKWFPMSFVSMSDSEVKETFEKLKPHFATLQKLVQNQFEPLKLEISSITLEPSFYSQNYGLQGRLDILHLEGRRLSIVEMKSGKPFKPNKYGLSHAHFVQTLMYDLLVRDTFPNINSCTAYILYSQIYENPICFAPVVKAQQLEALNVRNQLIGIESRLANLRDTTDPEQCILNNIKVENYPGLYGYILRDVMLFEQTYQSLDQVEKRYFNACVGLVSREHRMAKIGNSGREGMEGQAALWQKNLLEKESAFNILQYLEVVENYSDQEIPTLTFAKTNRSNPMANFRLGDLVILYPSSMAYSPLQHQLYKCSIIHMEDHQIKVRLRARQTNKTQFENEKHWNMEPDWLDSSFNHSLRALFEWAKTDKIQRQRLLGIYPPEPFEPKKQFFQHSDLTNVQQEVCSALVQSKGINVLWGPPGTGKTSKVLLHLVKYLTHTLHQKLLILAYTNKAVDEICDSLEKASEGQFPFYVRIGSRFGVEPRFRGQLLDVIAEQCQTRKELNEFLQSCEVVTGTIASIQGKPEIFELINFDRLIVDEASQILEPAMIGLLSKFNHAILIGDHLQLPAVVCQNANETIIQDESLKALGFSDLKISLFERLRKQYIRHGWISHIHNLRHQGRMHEEIMEFPNRFFYQGLLSILPAEIAHGQRDPIQLKLNPEDFDLPSTLIKKRVVFIPVASSGQIVSGSKSNPEEASMAVKLIDYFNKAFVDEAISIGVITPFRSQIATILHFLSEKGIHGQHVTVDTVERFQGGARDVVIVSLCVQSNYQLGQIVSMTSEGIDRKLNVALTRAKKHLIVLGDPEILRHMDIYRSFIKLYGPERASE